MKLTWKVSQVWLANWNGVTSFLHLVTKQQDGMYITDIDGFSWDTVRSHENVTWQKYNFDCGRTLSKNKQGVAEWQFTENMIRQTPCARILANLKGGRKPLALARHTPGPILSSSSDYSAAPSSVFDEANLLVTIWRPRAGTRQEKLHLLPGRHLVQPFV